MKFRKKPIVVEAGQFFPEKIPWPEGVQKTVIISRDMDLKEYEDIVFYIKTLEGTHTVVRGDWIITGIKGERYPCKPDIFNATYEPVD